MVRFGVVPGAFSFMRAASLMYDSQGKTLMEVWAKRSICAWAAATTLGCEWPTFITPMPPAKSMNSRPSVSVMMAFFALPMSDVVALDHAARQGLARRRLISTLIGSAFI